MITALYKFVVLPEIIREQNKIRSKARLDCISYSGAYDGLTFFVNKQNHLALYKVPAKEIVNANSKRIAEWTLTNNNLNFSSIYIEDFECPELGYGCPNKKPFIGKDKKPNPLFKYANDGYLFIINKDYTEIEVLIIVDGRNLISYYYQNLIDGNFDSELIELRKQAKPFFNYLGLNTNSKL
ncbi:MAG: hypothetical protein ACK5QC_15235 [Bacteroidota bacterium]|jgi:hypothetical protein|nr:hypothetical protein [Bacteroidota bacterium]